MTAAPTHATHGDAPEQSASPIAPAVHVLVVDDDGEIRRLLARFLKGHGYAVTGVPDGRAMHDALAALPIDLIILDVMLPGADGLELCRQIRARSAIPIIMLTARGEDTDRIVGLEIGADDYLAKPFNPRELLARIKAVLRRAPALAGPAGTKPMRAFTFEGWRLDTLRRELTNAAGVVVDLSGGEYDLLLAFLEAPQRVLSREHLLELSRNRVANRFDRSIDTQISRLRRKLEPSSDSERLIKTVRGVGYMFTPTVVRS